MPFEFRKLARRRPNMSARGKDCLHPRRSISSLGWMSTEKLTSDQLSSVRNAESHWRLDACRRSPGRLRRGRPSKPVHEERFAAHGNGQLGGPTYSNDLGPRVPLPAEGSRLAPVSVSVY